jgi:hypothetical protein
VTGFEAFLARVLPSWLFNAYRAFAFRPRPEIRVVGLYATGGASGKVTFTADVANYGTQQCRATFRASVAGEEARWSPDYADLIPNAPPVSVTIVVPRPTLGDLVPQFANEPTLYGQALVVEAICGKRRASEEWREAVYDAEANLERHEIQQRIWRDRSIGS